LSSEVRKEPGSSRDHIAFPWIGSKPTGRSDRRTCKPLPNVWRNAARSRRRIVSGRTAGRSSGMPSPPPAPTVIRAGSAWRPSALEAPALPDHHRSSSGRPVAARHRGLRRWRIPASKMKARVAHRALGDAGGGNSSGTEAAHERSAWVFPGVRTNGEPMSENTVNAALRRLVMTARC
jgi:hypothetical protein